MDNLFSAPDSVGHLVTRCRRRKRVIESNRATFGGSIRIVIVLDVNVPSDLSVTRGRVSMRQHWEQFAAPPIRTQVTMMMSVAGFETHNPSPTESKA
ncbi:hypothetical protein CCR75_005373 [Bremia lactucae]|uniref:Uncharacterized protein n=1 Tax=Bremia lactucae TaxID=4779 RepID=A0A976FF53_BRELC|nr:hypothetical protein CCR75_005373 [Bremia lactucae]